MVVNHSDKKFDESLQSRLGKEVYVTSKFFGINNPKLTVRGVLEFVGGNFLIVNSYLIKQWILVVGARIGYVVYTETPTVRAEKSAVVQQRLPIDNLSVYYRDILRVNLGREITVFINFGGKTAPDTRIFQGPLKYVGEDFLILGSVEIGGPLLLYLLNVSYVIFSEEPAVPNASNIEHLNEGMISANELLRLNINKEAMAWLNFVGGSPPEQRIIRGNIQVVNNDSLIILAKPDPIMPVLFFYANLAYLVFLDNPVIPHEAKK